MADAGVELQANPDEDDIAVDEIEGERPTRQPKRTPSCRTDGGGGGGGRGGSQSSVSLRRHCLAASPPPMTPAAEHTTASVLETWAVLSQPVNGQLDHAA